jgi:hypothetical protein
VDDSQLYPSFLGIDWAFDNHTIIDLKKRQMIFEVEDLKVTTSLDPTEERCYVEARKKELDNIYNMIVQIDDYVNSTIEGVVIWRSISSCASDSDEGMEY